MTGDDIPLVFGDSQADAGNAFARAGAPPGSVPQFPANQITNDDVFATQLGASFASGRSFAFADALAQDNIAAADNPFGIAIPGFNAPLAPDGDQIDLFLDSGLQPAAIKSTIIIVGANDVLDFAVSIDPTDLPSDAEIEAAAASIIGAITGGIGRLIGAGLSHFVVMGLPDASRFPDAVEVATQIGIDFGIPALEATIRDQVLSEFRELSQDFNALLQAALAGLPAQVDYFDTFGTINGLLDSVEGAPGADPVPASLAAITDTTGACLTDPLDPTTLCADPAEFFFYDSLHWSEAVHGELARAVEPLLKTHPAPQPVPLPAGGLLLIGGLGALVALRRARKAAA